MNVVVQHFHLKPGTLIFYEGVQIVVDARIKKGYAVYDRHSGLSKDAGPLVISDEFVSNLLARTDVEIDESFLDEAVQVARLSAKVTRGFSDLSPKEQREAQLKETFCLATKSILGRDCLKIKLITQNFDAIKSEAYKLQEKLHFAVPGAEVGTFATRSWGAKSVQSFCRAYFAMPDPDPFVLRSKHTDKGNYTPRMSHDASRLLDECCTKFCSVSQPKGASIVRSVNRAFKDENNRRRNSQSGPILVIPHVNTVYTRLKKIAPLRASIGRDGISIAQMIFSPTQHGVRALMPGEIIEIDFWKGDVFTFAKKSDFWGFLSPDLQEKLIEKAERKKTKKKTVQRLWICVATDVATRTCVGLSISETPNTQTVIDVLDMVMRDKSDLSRRAGCTNVWYQKCGLGTVVMDTGGEFFNHEVQAAILAAGGSFVYGRTGVPNDKPFQERFFGTLRSFCADELPGKTGSSGLSLPAYDKEGMAAFNFEELHLILIRAIVDQYQNEKHRGLMQETPNNAWKRAQKFGVVRAPLAHERRVATGLKIERKIGKHGIWVMGMAFSSPEFLKLFQDYKISEVDVRVDSTCLAEVTATVGGKSYRLENQFKSLAHHSVRTIMAAYKIIRDGDPKDNEVREYILAKHSERFANQIETAIDRHGLPSVYISAEKLDHFEKNFVFNTRVSKSPKAEVSADVDTFLSGGAGPGIYSAEDCAAAKLEERDEPNCEADEANIAEPTATCVKPHDDTAEPTTASRADQAKKMTKSKGFSGKPKGKGHFT